ncbi:hypothetical protein [Rhodopila sp.]|uniref:hypothetical protein n=1 Tax=Rhodopila sp. TaxID=2480087 RepID=UPI003D12D657
MTAIAQGGGGLALVMCFALLGTRQVGAATILLVVQSAAVAAAALAQHQALVAAAVVVDVVGASWFLRRSVSAAHASNERHRGGISAHLAAEVPDPWPAAIVAAERTGGGAAEWAVYPPENQAVAPPVGGAKSGILIGTALAMLCQSCGPLALPLAVVLLSILLAATRRHRLMRLTALVCLQNGLTLAVCLTVRAPLPALACFILPLPFALGLALGDIVHRDAAVRGWIRKRLGWVHLAVSLGLFTASLIIPLNPLGAVFAPLIGTWGVAEAWAERKRRGQTVVNRAAALWKLGFMLLAVGSPQPVVAWLCIVVAIAAAIFPTVRRRWDAMLLASCGAGLALFGLLTVPAGLVSVSCTALFVGYACVAAVVPDLGVVIVILILRLATQTHLPPIAGGILISVAVVALLLCSVLLTERSGRHRVTLLQLAQVSIAGMTLGVDLPQARFAVLVLLILLILTRAATRIAAGTYDEPATSVAIAGLGGIPPFGVFPGLVLILLAIGSHAPRLLLPIGLGLAATITASRPPGVPSWTRATALSPAWVPLALALLFGFFAPDPLVRWLHTAIAGIP